MARKPKAFKLKRTREDIIFNIICYTIFSVLVVCFFYPFYYLMICTISDNHLVGLGKVVLYPRNIHFTNYVNVLRLNRVPQAAWISLTRTVLGTTLHVCMTSYIAYFFTKTNMRFRTFAYRFFVVTMYFGAGLVPCYMNMKMLGLLNNYLIYVIPGMMSVYNMILVKTSMEALPASLEESAMIDGAGYLTRFFRIVLPLSKPILATIALFSAVSHWNDMFTTKLYITNTKLYTLQFVLQEFYDRAAALQEAMAQLGADPNMVDTVSTMSVRLTLTAVTVIPVMCVYPFVQKYYMKGLLLGAVKG